MLSHVHSAHTAFKRCSLQARWQNYVRTLFKHVRSTFASHMLRSMSEDSFCMTNVTVIGHVTVSVCGLSFV